MDEHTLHLRPPVWLPIVVVLIASVAYVAGKKVEVRGAPATISVTGEGKTNAVPDIAELSFGVQTGREKTAQAAMEHLAKNMNAIFDAVKAQGIEEKDIRTESLQLYPAYDWNEGERVDQGFEASQSLRVKVRDLEKIGAVLGAATSAGANQAGNVQFTIDDPETLQTEARAKAIRKAQENAVVLASQLGVKLGKIRSYSEGGGGFPPVYYERSKMMDVGLGGAEPLPIPAGEQEVQVTVFVTYEVQ